jgi:hypothetical protein
LKHIYNLLDTPFALLQTWWRVHIIYQENLCLYYILQILLQQSALPDPKSTNHALHWRAVSNPSYMKCIILDSQTQSAIIDHESNTHINDLLCSCNEYNNKPKQSSRIWLFLEVSAQRTWGGLWQPAEMEIWGVFWWTAVQWL